MELVQLIDPLVRAVDGIAGECVSMRVSNKYLIISYYFAWKAFVLLLFCYSMWYLKS